MSTTTSPGVVLADYLSALYPAGTTGELLAYVKEPFIRRFGSPDNLEDFARQIEELDAKHDVYLLINSLDGDSVRSRGEYARGNETEVKAAVAFVVDIDATKPEHNYPTQPQIIDALAEMPLAPSIIVVSGKPDGGLHAYYLFDTPFIIGTDANRKRIKSISKRWQELLRAKLAPYELDSTFDLVRVLRPIGTTNKKYGSVVCAKVFQPDRRFSVEEFESHLPPPQRATYTPPDNVNRNVAIARASSYVATMPGAISGQGGHNATLTVACRLVEGFSLSFSDAMPIMQSWNTTCTPQWGEKDLVHKIEDAIGKIERPGYLLNSENMNSNSKQSSQS
ncbi:MAG: hypothetical protein WCJ35_28650, partial [Planctomycetota bacterium]